MNKKISPAYYWLLLSLSAVAFSCEKDDPSPDHYVNSWIKENMDTWYFWNHTLPSTPASKTISPDPYFYFESLLYKPEDRFSWIQDNYLELLNSLKGVSLEAGYEFVLYKQGENSDEIIAQITYIKPNSPAALAGLKRGDVISQINSQQMTVGNYQELLSHLGENHSITYSPYNLEAETFGENETLPLTVVQYSENPNFLSKVITAGERKIGYYVYNFFAAGPDSESKLYDDEMELIFANFKAEGITDFVLDLRYNTGGSESSARNLASLIGRNISTSDVFVRKQYNPTVEDAIIEEYGEDFLISKFLSKTSNVGSLLTDNRVYVLTSSRTASASELIINSLKPYMDVFIIGNTTYGKNVGSISIYEKNDPKNTWGMQPIVVKVFNSLDQSEYSNGFEPNILDKDNRLNLKPLGDANEALLKRAIDHISGNDVGRIAQTNTRQSVGHSLDHKRRSFTLTIEQDQELLKTLMK